MRDEAPIECQTANQGVDTYCLLAIAYAKIAQLEDEVEVLKAR